MKDWMNTGGREALVKAGKKSAKRDDETQDEYLARLVREFKERHPGLFDGSK